MSYTTAFSAYGLNVFELLSGMTAGEYKRFKGLKKQNLRDNMTDMELILSMLAEESTEKYLNNFRTLPKKYQKIGKLGVKTRLDKTLKRLTI